MNSALPKIAAVIFTVGSIGMMGTSLAAYFNRLDYTSHMDDPVITDYKFNSSTSDGKTSWTVTPSKGDDRAEKRKDTGYAALQEAYKHKTNRLNALTGQMNQLTSQLTDQKSLVDTEQEVDQVALNQRKQQLTGVVNSVEEKYLLLSQQHQELITESQSVRAETADRREDVIRLKSELEELRTDQYRLQELRRELTDRLIRLQLENQSIEQRLQQIRQQVK